MNRNSMVTIGVTTVWLAVLSGFAFSAQDKYIVKVPGGLAFSDFRGYEAWQAISISRNERVIAMILGNPVMIDAYQAGIPGNGKPVPDGAKMAKGLVLQRARRHKATTPDAVSPAIREQRREITFLQSTGSGEASRAPSPHVTSGSIRLVAARTSRAHGAYP